MNQAEMHDLIVRAKQKDKEAIVKLYRGSCDRVYFYCFKTLGEPLKAAAAVYEIFSLLFRNIDKIDGMEDLYMEIDCIMVKVCKKGPDKAFSLPLEENEAAYELNNGNNVDIAGKIDYLPENQKRITLLYHYEKLSMEQIAEIEGISIEEVSEELDRAGAAICDDRSEIGNALEIGAGMHCIPESINRQIISKLTGQNCSFLTKPLFLKVRVWHLAVLLLVAVIVVGICIGCKAQTVPTKAGDSYMIVKMADFPDEIREQISYYATGFYNDADFKVTPEMAYIRTVGGYNYYNDNWLDPAREEMEICWYGNNTNILSLFDEDKELIAYIYGYAPSEVKPEDYPEKLKLHTGFEIDGEAVISEAVSNTKSMIENAYILDEDDVYCRYSDADDAYVFDINFDSVPFAASEVTGDKIQYTDIETGKAREMFVYSLSQYWLGEGKTMGEEVYNYKDRGLNIVGYGEYNTLDEEEHYDKVFIAVYGGETIIAVGYLDADKLDIPDYVN